MDWIFYEDDDHVEDATMMTTTIKKLIQNNNQPDLHRERTLLLCIKVIRWIVAFLDVRGSLDAAFVVVFVAFRRIVVARLCCCRCRRGLSSSRPHLIIFLGETAGHAS